ncbi:hypothetical protein FO519_008517 [Halicephalobus sp. NKZ332]|nr:hypothetical protein FO519_008517 [Halicephalobus sp. NKZ332]
MTKLVFSLILTLIQVDLIFTEKNESKIVETTYGKIQGFEYFLKDGSVAEIFLGIPFAQPPTEKNRFEKPKILQKWEGIKKATAWKPGCIAFYSVVEEKHDTSEDCLYLNIFAPKSPSPNPDGYPVLVWIHGGGFQHGSAVGHGFEVLSESFVSKGVIVVSVQYRLGPLGFAAWGDDNFPGNYGLWDLWSALKFLRRNIQGFGGDPNRVTLWGESAGAALVSALSISKHTRDMFSQALQNSGSQFAEWANTNRVIQASEVLGKKLTCDTDDSQKFKDCLKGKTLKEIQVAFIKAGAVRRKDFNHIKFQPRLDADFFTDDLRNLIAESPKKPTIMGFALEEALWLTTNPNFDVGIEAPEIVNFSEEKFVNFIKHLITEVAFPEKHKTVQKKVIDFYLNTNPPAKKDGLFYFRKYTQLLSDVMFNMPIINEAKIKADNEWKVYLYLASYINKEIFPKQIPIKKPLHAYEYPYIFNITDIPFGKEFKRNDDDLEFTRILIDTMVNFIKTGNPSTEDIDWRPLTKENKYKYLELKPFSPEMKQPIMADRIQFWTLLTKHSEFDLIRGIHKATLRSRDEL